MIHKLGTDLGLYPIQTYERSTVSANPGTYWGTVRRWLLLLYNMLVLSGWCNGDEKCELFLMSGNLTVMDTNQHW